MNKYQEALNDMYAVLNDSKRWHERKSLLQELVDKETPMKPCYGSDYPSGDCPICGNNIGDNPRCRDCGQKIDWSEDE